MFSPGVSRLDVLSGDDRRRAQQRQQLVLPDGPLGDQQPCVGRLGARFEHVNAESTGDIVSINNNRIVPRAAVSFDVTGDGDKIVHVTYGQYSGRYNEAQIGRNSPVGNSPSIDSMYRGPAGQGLRFRAAGSIRRTIRSPRERGSGRRRRRTCSWRPGRSRRSLTSSRCPTARICSTDAATRRSAMSAGRQPTCSIEDQWADDRHHERDGQRRQPPERSRTSSSRTRRGAP